MSNLPEFFNIFYYFLQSSVGILVQLVVNRAVEIIYISSFNSYCTIYYCEVYINEVL